jgi:tetratricopeptide (TPR) repeat protein
VSGKPRRLWNVPYPSNPFFVGRDKELALLHTRLNEGLSSSNIQAVVGLGGIGKTQVALRYAFRYREEYGAVFWVDAATLDTQVVSFSELLNLLELPVDIQNPELVKAAVKHWLNANGGWLLILDNADDLATARLALPQNTSGHIIMTSRPGNLDDVGVFSPVELDNLDEDDAVDFIYNRIQRSRDDTSELAAAKALVVELGCLPLALEQAGAYIKAKQAQLQDYLTSYLAQPIAVLERNGPRVGGYPSSVARTWMMNITEVSENPATAEILTMSAFLAPDRIPTELLISGSTMLGSPLSDTLRNVDKDPLLLDELLEPLTRYSLIRRHVADCSYSIHRLVQAVLQDNLDEGSYGKWIGRVADLLNYVFPRPDVPNWELCSRLVSHGQLLVQRAVNTQLHTATIGRLANQIGLYLDTRGDLSSARTILESAINISKTHLGPDHSDTATSINNLADVCQTCGLFSKAEGLYKEALAIRERKLGSTHEDTLASINGIAGVYSSTGRYNDAERLFTHILNISIKVHGAYNTESANTLSNLALCLRRKGDHAGALANYELALPIIETARGPEHPNVAAILNNIGTIYRSIHDYEKAEKALLRALAISEKVLGAAHHYTATCLNSLASLYKDTQRYSEAEDLYHRAISADENLFGQEHPHTANAINNLGILYIYMLRYSEADAMLRRALLIREKVLGLEHPDVATSINNIANLLLEQHLYAESEPYFKKALVMREKVLGFYHIDTLRNMTEYIKVLRLLGRNSLATLVQAQLVARQQKRSAVRASD